MTEREFRTAIILEASSWISTPYKNCGAIKGVGVNCAMFLYAVAKSSGVLPADAPEPRWYTSQLATNSKEERLIDYIKAYGAREISERDIASGDIVVYKTGLSHGHAAIVLSWPEIIHCIPPRGCDLGIVDEGKLARYSRRYFSLWKAA